MIEQVAERLHMLLSLTLAHLCTGSLRPAETTVQRGYAIARATGQALRDSDLHSALVRQLLFSGAVLAAEIPLGIALALAMPAAGWRAWAVVAPSVAPRGKAPRSSCSSPASATGARRRPPGEQLQPL